MKKEKFYYLIIVDGHRVATYTDYKTCIEQSDYLDTDCILETVLNENNTEWEWD